MLNNINHKMPIYKDCTLGEIMTIAISSFIILTLIFSTLTKLLIGYIWPGYLFSSILFIFVTKLLLSQLQKIKYGKPYGYYQHLIIKKLSKIGLYRDRYVTRFGRWSVRRYLQ